MSEAMIGGEDGLLTAARRAAFQRSVIVELQGSLARLNGTGPRLR